MGGVRRRVTAGSRVSRERPAWCGVAVAHGVAEPACRGLVAVGAPVGVLESVALHALGVAERQQLAAELVRGADDAVAVASERRPTAGYEALVADDVDVGVDGRRCCVARRIRP